MAGFFPCPLLFVAMWCPGRRSDRPDRKSEVVRDHASGSAHNGAFHTFAVKEDLADRTADGGADGPSFKVVVKPVAPPKAENRDTHDK